MLDIHVSPMCQLIVLFLFSSNNIDEKLIFVKSLSKVLL